MNRVIPDAQAADDIRQVAAEFRVAHPSVTEVAVDSDELALMLKNVYAVAWERGQRDSERAHEQRRRAEEEARRKFMQRTSQGPARDGH